MRIKGVLFDLDGTLANTLQDLKDSLNMAMADLGLPLHDDESVKKCINNGMKAFVMRSVPEELRTDELLEKVSLKYHHYYGINHINKTCFYDGITELLHRLKNVYGMKIAVISNKDDLYTKNIVNALDAEHCIDVAYGFREGIPHKPAPDSVYGIIEELGLKKEEVVLVGDSQVDVKTAKNAGITSFGVLWGFKGAQSFVDEQPDYLLEKPLELENLLLEMK